MNKEENTLSSYANILKINKLSSEAQRHLMGDQSKTLKAMSKDGCAIATKGTEMITDTLMDAARHMANAETNYGDVDKLYKKAARIASLRLETHVTPYMIAVISQCVVDCQTSANSADIKSYADSARLASMAAHFSTINFPTEEQTMLDKVEQALVSEMDDIKDMAAKLAPPKMPNVDEQAN